MFLYLVIINNNVVSDAIDGLQVNSHLVIGLGFDAVEYLLLDGNLLTSLFLNLSLFLGAELLDLVFLLQVDAEVVLFQFFHQVGLVAVGNEFLQL